MQLNINSIYGLSPVLGDGDISGCPFTFRACGGSWQFEVFSSEDEEGQIFFKSGPWGDGPFDAGSMPEETARQFIEEGAGEFWERYTGPDKP